MDYLMGKTDKKSKVSHESEVDDDMDFGKSVLFDDVMDEDEGEDGFGEWNKMSKKKERSIFERKK